MSDWEKNSEGEKEIISDGIDLKIKYDEDYFDDLDMADIQAAIKLQKEYDRFGKWKFKKHLSYYSFYNELPSEIIFHCILSAILKDIPLDFGREKQRTKVHLLWQQPSGSGKGMAFEETEKILKEYNKITDKPLNIVWLDGSETTESYYNRFEMKGTGGYNFENPIPGLLEIADILFVEEASFFFTEKQGQKQKKAELFLKALEDRTMTKTIASWNGRIAYTNPNFVLIASTRPTTEVQQTMATSGFMQRMVPFYRNLTNDERTDMSSKDVKNSIFREENKETLDKERVDIAKELLNIREWVKLNKDARFKFENRDDIFQLMMKHHSELMKKIYDTLIRFEHQEIAEAFLARGRGHIFNLALQNAILRKSTIINNVDIELAYELYSETFRQLLFWIQGNIVESRMHQKRRSLFIRYLKLWFKNKEKIPLKEFYLKLMQQTQYSRGYSEILTKRYSVGKNSLIKIVDNYVILNKKDEVLK